MVANIYCQFLKPPFRTSFLIIVQRCFSSTSIISCLGPFSYSKFLKIIYYVCKWRPLWGFWKPTSCRQSLINRVDLVRKIRPSTIKHSIVGSQGKIFATRALQSSLDGYRLARSSAEEWAWRERIPALRSRHPLHRRDALHAHQLGSGGIAVLRHSQVQWCLQTSRIGGWRSWAYNVGHPCRKILVKVEYSRGLYYRKLYVWSAKLKVIIMSVTM